MDLIKEYFVDKEEIEGEYSFSKKATVKNFLISNVFFIFMWAVMLFASFYFLAKLLQVSGDYWFVIITPLGLCLLRTWTVLFEFIKTFQYNKNVGYVLTNNAFYYYDDGAHKKVTRIAIEDIVEIKKAEFITDGFYVSSKNEYICVKNILLEKQLFEKLEEKMKQ